MKFGIGLNALVWAGAERKPLLMPDGCLRAKIRQRANDLARVYLSFADRTEHWLIEDEGDHWKPAIMQGANIRVQTTPLHKSTP